MSFSFKKAVQLSIASGLLFTSVIQSFGSDNTGQQIWTAEQAVAFALKNSPDSEIALARIQTASAQQLAAQSANYPVIGLHGGYSQTDNPMYSFGNILNQGEFNNTIDFNNPGRTDNLNLTADIRYRLYNGGMDSASVDSAEAQIISRKQQYEVVKNQLAFEVVKSFQSIIQAQDALHAEEASLKAIEASLAVAKARFDAGDLLKEEVLNLEVQQARAMESVLDGNHQIQLTQRIFLNLLGLKDGSVNINGNDALQAVPEHVSYTGRPEISMVENSIASAEAELKKAQGGNLPTLDGFASYQYDKGFELDGSGDSWMAGIKVDYNLYQGNRTNANIALAKSQLLQLKKELAKTELSLNLDLQQAELGYKLAKERKGVTDKMVETAEESARLSRIRFREGVILSSNLIDVETRLTEALLKQSTAKANYIVSIANLRRAAGLPQY